MTSAADSHPETDLVISRVLAAPRAALWRAWTEPELLRQWWCPRPWTTEVRAFELRPGGAFHTFMQGPEGGSSDNPGCFVEIVPQQRLVFTSMLGGGWRPQTPVAGLHRGHHLRRRRAGLPLHRAGHASGQDNP